MKLRYRLAQFAAVFGAAIFLFAVPALAQECPQLVDQIGWSSPAHQVAASADYVYIGNDDGVLVVHYLGPGEFEVVGGVGLPEVAQNIEVSAGYVYVADGESGLRVLDVTDPASPFEVGNYAPSEGAFSEVAIFGGTAYVIDPDFGLRVIDVTDPYSPFEVGSFHTTNPDCTDVDASGHHAYITCSDLDAGGLRVIDATEPFSPFEVGFLPGLHRSVVHRGGYAYTLNGFDVTVVDVRNPSAPVEVWSDSVCEFCGKIAVSNRLVLKTSWGGMAVRGSVISVFDTTDPYGVTYLGSEFESLVWLDDLAVSGRYAYVAAGGDGVYVYDVLGCGMEIFTDSFESGGTTAWSNTVP